MDNKRTQFTFYANYRDTAQMCETEEGKLEWYNAIIGFALDGAEPEFTSPDAKLLRVAWINVLPHLNKSHQRSKAAKKRGEAKSRAPSVPTDEFFNT